MASPEADLQTSSDQDGRLTPQDAQERRIKQYMLVAPAEVMPTFELSVHRCLPRMGRELKDVFGPQLDVDNLLVVPTFQVSGGAVLVLVCVEL
jgi:hypothetical protein